MLVKLTPAVFPSCDEYYDLTSHGMNSPLIVEEIILKKSFLNIYFNLTYRTKKLVTITA
jgi:hypothetical protein